MTEMLELSDKHFKATTIKMLQRAMTNTLETNLKKGREIQYKELNGIFITEKYSNNNSNNQNTHLNGGAQQQNRGTQ